MTKTLQRQDGSIAYDDTGGSGPLVVAAPGMGDMRSVYRHLIPLVADRGFRIATMDLRGMGESSTEWPDYSDAAIGSDMLALAHHLDAGPAILLGNSLTASSAVIAATDDPKAVAGLVLVGPFARDVPQPGWQKLAFRLALARPWGKGFWVSYYRKNMYPGAKPEDHDEYVDALAANLSEPGRFKGFKSLAFNSHTESESRLDQVGCRIIIVMGSDDPDFTDPAVEAQFLGERLNAEVVMVPGAGHYPQAQAPEMVADAVARITA